jgi:hypothetical protein
MSRLHANCFPINVRAEFLAFTAIIPVAVHKVFFCCPADFRCSSYTRV